MRTLLDAGACEGKLKIRDRILPVERKEETVPFSLFFQNFFLCPLQTWVNHFNGQISLLPVPP